MLNLNPQRLIDAETVMRKLFKLTLDALVYLSQLTGWTYKEVNVIVWYFVIPATWAILLDKIFGTNWFKITFAATAFAILGSVDFSSFCSQLFDRSAEFLNSFQGVGSNYVSTSVIICVFVPLAIYAVLFWFAFVRSLFSFVSHRLPPSDTL